MTSLQLRVFIDDQSAGEGLVEMGIFGKYALISYSSENICRVARQKLNGKSIELGQCITIRARIVKRNFDTAAVVKIRQLPVTVGIKEIEDACSLFGVVKSLKLKKGHGYVKFFDLDSATKAIRFLNSSVVMIGGSAVSAKIRKRPVRRTQSMGSTSLTNSASSMNYTDSANSSGHTNAPPTMPPSPPSSITLPSPPILPLAPPALPPLPLFDQTSLSLPVRIKLSPIATLISSSTSTCTSKSLASSSPDDSTPNSADNSHQTTPSPLLQTSNSPHHPPTAVSASQSPLSPSHTIIVQFDKQPNGLVTSSDLYHYFNQFGPIDVSPVIHSSTPDHVYVKFSSISDAVKACEKPVVMLKNVKLSVKPHTEESVPEMETKLYSSNDPLLDQIIVKTCRSSLFYSNVTLQLVSSAGIQVTGSKSEVDTALLLLDIDASCLNLKLMKRFVQYQYHKIPQLSNTKLFNDIQKRNCVQFFIAKEDESHVDMVDSLCDKIAQWLQQSARPVKKTELFKKFVEEKYKGAYAYSWLFEDDSGQYFEMDTSIAQAVEGGYQVYLNAPKTPQTSCAVQQGAYSIFESHCYRYDFQKMTQTNWVSNKVRNIKRSEIYTMTLECRGFESDITAAFLELDADISKPAVTSVEVEEENQIEIFNMANEFCVEALQLEPGKLTLQGEKEYIDKVSVELLKARLSAVTRRNSKSDDIGPNWEPQKEIIELKNVSRLLKEWEDIEKLFKATLPNSNLRQIQRIQNKWLWEKYSFCRKRMIEKNGVMGANEMMLFHGTRQTPPKVIYTSEHGFDFRFGTSGGLWGKGAYFACDAYYSNNYAYKQVGNSFCGNQNQMFLAFVLTGDSFTHRVDRTLDKPPIKNFFTLEHYDSINGITASTKIYVVYDHDKSYPAYLITYI